MILLYILAVLLSLFVVFTVAWAFLVSPGRADERMEKYKSVKYAHRGLHGEGACENSLSAFKRAKDVGYGIELDIRLSRDGELVVFHDSDLQRVVGIDKKVDDMTVEELRGVRLADTDDYVPTFREVLDLVGGRVPLLVEIKVDSANDKTAEKFLREIEGYNGDYIVESFNPSALRVVKRARPDILVGLLSMEYSGVEKFKGKPIFKCLELLLSNFMYRPNFIAYEKSGAKKKYLHIYKKLFDVPFLAWTVKSEDEENASKELFDSVIFEQYMPEK